MSDDTARGLLRQVIEEANRPDDETRAVIVFDLDGTLYDNRGRTLAIVHEYAAESTTGELRERLEALRLHHIHYLLSDALRTVGVPDAEVDGALGAALTTFWVERFFDNRYVKHDVPHPGGLDFARACYEAGANLVYLTGRDIPKLLEGTAAKLRDDGFPIAVPGVQLVLKPHFDDDDEVFKRATLPGFSRLGEVRAFFDNEPGNCNLALELFPTAHVALLDTAHRPDAPPLYEGIPRIRDFALD